VTDVLVSTPAAAPVAPVAAASPPRRIGYVVSIFPELTETFIAREIEALRRRGHAVHVFAVKRPRGLPPGGAALCDAATLRDATYARPDHLPRHLLANVVALVRHPLRYGAALRVFTRQWSRLEPGRFARLLYHFACGIGLTAELRRRGIEQLHAHFTTGANIALAAHLYSGIPFSFTAHASDDLFVQPVLLAEKVEHARAVMPVCDYSRRYLDAVTGYAHSGKLHRVYNGIDVSEPARLAAAGDTAAARASGGAGGAGGPLRLLSVGSLLGDAKGFVTLVEVCGELRRSGYDLRCRIVGGGAPAVQAMLARRIAAAGLTDVVELAGAQPLAAVYAAMREADVFVLLSEVGLSGLRDGFPTVLLEAMALRLPVVSTWVSGIPEIVRHGVTGFLVPERRPRAAAAAIGRLADDAALRARFGQAGWERVRRRFDLERSADRLARVLAGLVRAPVEATR
jgi:glycosyltransferase involved in cell wall biosynthesis